MEDENLNKQLLTIKDNIKKDEEKLNANSQEANKKIKTSNKLKHPFTTINSHNIILPLENIPSSKYKAHTVRIGENK